MNRELVVREIAQLVRLRMNSRPATAGFKLTAEAIGRGLRYLALDRRTVAVRTSDADRVQVLRVVDAFSS